MGFRPFKGSSWSSGFALMAGLSSDDRSALLKALQLQLQLYDNGRIVELEWKWDWSSPNIFYLTISPTLGLGLFYRCAEWRWLHSKATGVVEETGWSARAGPCSFPTASENQHQLIKYITLFLSFSVAVWTISLPIRASEVPAFSFVTRFSQDDVIREYEAYIWNRLNIRPFQWSQNFNTSYVIRIYPTLPGLIYIIYAWRRWTMMRTRGISSTYSHRFANSYPRMLNWRTGVYDYVYVKSSCGLATESQRHHAFSYTSQLIWSRPIANLAILGGCVNLDFNDFQPQPPAEEWSRA